MAVFGLRILIATLKMLFVFTIDCEYIAVKDGQTLRLNVLALNTLVLNSCAKYQNKSEVDKDMKSGPENEYNTYLYICTHIWNRELNSFFIKKLA